MWKFYSRRDHCLKEKICIYRCSALIFFRQRRSSPIQTRILRVMADNLSEDLIVEILVRLPIKSLLRFRCVCKPWFSLITSSTFINAHIDHNHHHNNSLLLVRSYKDLERKVGYTLCQDNETIDEIMKIDLPFATNNQFFRILGCVNGLVCLVDDVGRRTDQVILWNPVIRRSLALPNPNIALNYTIHRDLVYGFGCGRFTNNDYKIVRILSPNEKSNLPQGQPLVEIFRLSMGIWENLDAPASLPLLDSRQDYLNGTIHWLANGPSIVAFDVDAEVFREVKLPNALQRSSLDSLIVASWRNSLSVFEVQRVGDFCLWVMEEYGLESSWTRRFAVKSFGVPRWIRSHRKNGEVILVENGRRLVSFDPEINQIRDSGIQAPGTLRAFHMKPYMESLVLIDQDDAAPVLHLEKDIC